MNPADYPVPPICQTLDVLIDFVWLPLFIVALVCTVLALAAAFDLFSSPLQPPRSDLK